MEDQPLHTNDEVGRLQARVADLERELEQARAQATHQPAEPPPYQEYAPLLGMLLEVSAALRITHDVPTVLALIEQKVPLLFNQRTRALIFLADERRQLVLRTRTSADAPLTLMPGQGIGGRGFFAPRAMLFTDGELESALGDLSAEQLTTLRQTLAPFWPPHSAIAASLRVHEQLVGVLSLYNCSETAPFSSFDLPFVQALADLAAVAIVDAQQRDDLTHARAMHARAQAQLDSAQAQLLQSARLAAVGELSASVAHEINNPLYAARNSLFLATRKLPPESSDAREYVQLAQDELGRIARIIGRMRDFYRPTRAELAPTDLNGLLEETLSLVQTHLRHGHVQVVFEPDQRLPPLIVSADQIRQVVLNLILNACDAMASRGGTLTVRSTAVDGRATGGADAPSTGISHFATAVTITIADTGVGIPPDIISQLFTPFFTTKPQGTGLGLAISGHIVTQHGGHISVDSTPGQGSTFTIHLPLDGPVGSLLNTNGTSPLSAHD